MILRKIAFFAIALTCYATADVVCENLDDYQDDLSSYATSEQVRLFSNAIEISYGNACFNETGSDNLFFFFK